VRSRTRRTAEELEALLEGRLPADEAGAEARRLASLATTVAEERPGPVATLAEDRRLLLRDRLLDDIAALDASQTETVGAPASSRRPAKAAIASGLASAMIAATGVTVAAQEALPGDALYGLKKGTESVRMNLAADATQAARLELRFAEARLGEITAGAERLTSPALVASLAEMDRRSMAGAQQLVLSAEATDDEALLLELGEFLERQSSNLVGVFGRLPVEVRPHAEDSLALLREIHRDLLMPAIEACDCIEVVPAGHAEPEPVARTTSDPLPAAPAEEPDPEPRQTSSGSSSESAPAPAPSAPSGGSGSGTGTETTDVPRTTSRVGETVERTTEGVGEVVDKTTDTVGETVDRTTERVGDTAGRVLDSTSDVVDKTTDTVGDTLDKTTEGVGDTLKDTTDCVGDLLGTTTDTLGGLLGR
jgi:hypothetical protein